MTDMKSVGYCNSICSIFITNVTFWFSHAGYYTLEHKSYKAHNCSHNILGLFTYELMRCPK